MGYDDLHVAEEKVAHLNDIKAKLESTLDELEGGVAGEKRARAGVDSQRRKVEGELKMAQETVSEIEAAKRVVMTKLSLVIWPILLKLHLYLVVMSMKC